MATLCCSLHSEPGSRPCCALRGLRAGDQRCLPRWPQGLPAAVHGCRHGAGSSLAQPTLSHAGAQQAAGLRDGVRMGVLPAATGRVHGAAGLALLTPGIAARWGCVRAGGQNRHERKMLSPADWFQRFLFALTWSELGGVFGVRGQSLGSCCMTGSLCSPTHEPRCSLGHSSAGSGSARGRMQLRRDRSHLQST